ncbi:MAG: S41 family peptidase, partial [Phycisphaerae bacterium]|nr:S41 family peptidase [Phycisphaerae bacterium]
FSRYIPPDRAEAFKRQMAGKVRGLGLVVDSDPLGLGLVVVCVYPGSPADKAGLEIGNLILAINGLPTDRLDLTRIRRILRADGDAVIHLRFSGAEPPAQTVTLAPAEFAIDAVTGLYRGRAGGWVYLVDNKRNIAYFRVREFIPGTVEQFQRAFRRLAGEDIRGLVLDLRDNPGGLMPQAVALANLFLQGGPIVTVVGRGGQLESHQAHTGGTYPDILMVVLVNGSTASAAEIVAGSLHRAGRGVLVGRPTCGKHCVQSVFELDGQLGLVHLTTAMFFFDADLAKAGTGTGAGLLARVYPSRPVMPHVLVDIAPQDRRKLQRLRWGAWAASRARPDTAPASRPAASLGARLVEDLLQLDAPLARAVELLQRPEKILRILAAAARNRRARQTARPAATAIRTAVDDTE